MGLEQCVPTCSEYAGFSNLLQPRGRGGVLHFWRVGSSDLLAATAEIIPLKISTYISCAIAEDWRNRKPQDGLCLAELPSIGQKPLR
jgi:hypothetical protein